MIARAVDWLRTALITAAHLARQAVVSVRYNWGIGLLSVVLAISLWVFVTDQDDPERSVRVRGSIPVECVNVPSGKAESPPCIETQSVTVRVRAPESIAEDLTADDFSASADLSSVSTDRASVPVRVLPSEPSVDIIDISPAEIDVQLEDVTSMVVPARARTIGSPARGFSVLDVTLEPEEATVTGPETLVARVAAVEADVNLTGVRTNLEQSLELQARDELGAPVRGLEVLPETALVRVELQQDEFTAPFIVLPEVSGAPALGFRVAAVEVEPPIVSIRGTAEVFQTLDPVEGIMTEPISIEGATADVVRAVSLQLPAGAESEQPGVTVRVIIQPAGTPATVTPGSTPEP